MKKDWTYKKLGEVAETYRGLTYSKADEAVSSSKGVLRSNNIDLVTHQLNFDEIKYLREDFVVPEEKKVKKNSIFICMSNGSMQHLGKVAYIDKDYDFAFGGFMGLIVPKEDICSKYVYYALLSPNFITEILKNGKGANINNLRFTDVEQYSLPIPPISIQESIVRELDAIHGILEKKQEQLRELDNLAQAIFYDMFGDPITNPMGWEIKKLGECFPYIKNGANIKQDRNAGGIPITRIETLSGGVFNRHKLGYADIFELGKYEHYVLSDGDLLLSHINSKIYIGRTVEYKKYGNEQIIHGMNLLCLKADKEILSSTYFAYFTHCEKFKNDIARIRKDAVNQSSISISDLKNFSLPLPPLSLQQSFAAKIEAIEAQKQAVQQSIREVEALLAERMDHYFS